MNRIVLLLGLLVLVPASCASTPSEGAGRTSDNDPGGEGGALDRVHIYEVDAAQARAGRAATDTATISVQGRAEVSASPDMVRVAFAVETIHEEAREASAENARLMTAVHEALRATGFEGIRIETFGYNLQPNYRRPSGDRTRPLEIENYRLTNNIRATVADVEAAGALIDAAIGAGANRVTSLHFDIQDKEPLRLEALRLAVRKAEEEAGAIAEALGVRLGAPVHVQGGAEIPSPRMMDQRVFAAAEAAPPTPIEAGLQTVTANVSIRYRIDGLRR